ncbi:hypothetical protein [Paraliobacillus ryukyuensis]|uniref:hypothetical protein n=1 Tax=Paraliobacillus ryukyuensis TaxID=200904 RepID=UPI0009A5E6ED|nr:hypothetical protein [Paraliobacillus ryukyuensis]
MKNTIKGKYMEDDRQIINEALKNESFNRLIQEMDSRATISIEYNHPVLAYEFEQTISSETLKCQFVVFESKDGKTRLRYDKAIVGDKANSVVSGKTIVQENNKNVLKGLAIINGEKHWMEDQFKDALDDIPDLEDDQTLEPQGESEDVEAMARFCLYDFPEFYNHCGPDCGDGLPLGGGTPINGLDTCCRAHDRCWREFGEGDCECDAILVGCAIDYIDTYPTNASAVIGWFGNVNNC